MNFADIQKTWRSPHNRPPAAEMEKQKMKFITDLRARRRANLGLLVITLLPLLFLTGKVVFHVLWPDPALDKVDLTREWGIIPFFALPWIGWLFMVRQYRQHRQRHPNCENSIAASVAALLDENQVERRRYQVIAGLLIASVAILPVIIHQLRAVGKAGDEILIPAYVVWPAYVLLTLAWAAYHYRSKLLPRKKELEALLAEYRDEPGFDRPAA